MSLRATRHAAWTLPLLGIAGVIALWATLLALGALPRTSVASPSEAARSLAEVVKEGEFWTRLRETLWSWLVGLLVASAIGIPLGVLLGASPRAFRFTRIVVEALRPIPPVVILPLALLVLGGALSFKVALIVQGALWPLVVQTSYGVRSIDPVVLETAATFQIGKLRQLFQVQIPAASVQIATGLRLAAATAFAVCLVSEIVGGARGLGAYMIGAQIADDRPRVMALTIVAGTVGLVISIMFGVLQRRMLRWAPAAGN